MNAKIENYTIPAGIVTGIEGFVHQDKKFLIVDGVTTLFEKAPAYAMKPFRDAFWADRKGRAWIQEHFGLSTVEAVFFQWYKCNFGALDDTADVDANTGEVVKDVNSFCGDADCKMAGIECCLPYGLKMDQVKTLRLIKQGKKSREIKQLLDVSFEAVRSRRRVLFVKFNVSNVAELSTKTPLIH